MIARNRSFSALTVAKRPASRSALLASRSALSLHSAHSFRAASAASAASATTSRHAASTWDSVRGLWVPPPTQPPLAPARATLSWTSRRAFSAFSFSSATVNARFLRLTSMIFVSRTPDVTRLPPVSSDAASSAPPRSFASSA